MLVQACPACHRPEPRLIESTSKIARVDYYACTFCSHIWTASKENGEFLANVTPLDETQPANPSLA